MSDRVCFDMVAWLAEFPPPLEMGPAAAALPKKRGAVPADHKAECARRYIAKCPIGVEGQGGSYPTFAVACHLIKGFDFSIEEARPLMEEYCARCDPPWTDAQIQHKLEDAHAKIDDKPRGWLYTPMKALREGTTAAIPEPEVIEDPEAPAKLQKAMIMLNTDEYICVDLSIMALARCENLFQKGNTLLTIVDDTEDVHEHGVDRPVGSPRFMMLPKAKLRTRMTEYITFFKNVVVKTDDGYEEKLKVAHPSDWVVDGVFHDQVFKWIPKVETIIESPIMRSDGTFVWESGYDSRTRTYYRPNADFGEPLADFSEDAARAAALRLGGLVDDFPFDSPLHKAAWLAALLTPFARFAMKGNCPAFVFDANSAGSGKSLLCDLISMMLTGRVMSRTTLPERDDELRKRITSMAMGGTREILVDNITAPFGGQEMDAVITSEFWEDRILGASAMTGKLPINFIWYITGNNIAMRGDIHRRIIPCRLVSLEENPQDRDDFAVEDILDHVRENRAGYVRDALTILGAYHAAGRPKVCKKPLGSFESWSSLIRSAVLWVTGEHDVVDTQAQFRDNDSKSLFLHTFISGWQEISDPYEGGLSPSQALSILRASSDDQYQRLRETLASISKGEMLPTVTNLTYKLRDLRDRVADGLQLKFTVDPSDGTGRWYVDQITEEEIS